MVLMMAMRDEETQKRGVVGIPYNVGRDHAKDREAVWKAAKLVSILPVRFTGIHYCFSDEKVQLLFSLAMFVFNKNARIRCRLHMGTHMECIYKLVSALMFYKRRKRKTSPADTPPGSHNRFILLFDLLSCRRRQHFKTDDIRYTRRCNTGCT